jgi:hypothetical protein
MVSLAGRPFLSQSDRDLCGARAPILFLDGDVGGPNCLPARPRRDALPEHTDYADTGCDLHPSCLACPLERCRYDEPGGARRLASDERDRSVLSLRNDAGLPIGAIAGRFGISRRTVFRILASDRKRRPAAAAVQVVNQQTALTDQACRSRSAEGPAPLPGGAGGIPQSLPNTT